jgi:hypothetical protein
MEELPSAVRKSVFLQPTAGVFVLDILINSTFNKLKSSAFLTQAQTIVTNMTGNVSFPEPWASTVPPLAQIEKDLAAFQEVANATAAGDRTRIAERNGARTTLATDLTLLGFYVQGVAKGDLAMLASTGFPLRTRTPRSQALDSPEAPQRLRLSRGTNSGSLVVRAGRVINTGAYDVQITSADPTVEANWTAAGSYKNCNRIELTGLATLKTWSVRVRALGAAGPGAWTMPVSLMVL